MDLHSDWMTNNELFGTDFTKNFQLQSVKDRFELQRNDSLEGYTVIIDGFSERVVVQNHTNPLNDFKDNKKLFCAMDSKVHDGSSVVFEGKDYLVTNKVVDNQAYKSAVMTECNDTLKYQLPNKLISMPCIITLAMRSSLNVQENNFIITEDNVFLISVTVNDDVKQIPNGSRFIFSDKKAYKTIAIDTVSQPGLIHFKVKSDEIRDTDDLVNEIADNGVEVIDSTSTNPTGAMIISGSDECIVGEQQTYHAEYDDGSVIIGKTFTWTITDMNNNTTQLATILSNDSLSCTIQATDIGQYGNVILHAKCIEDNTIELTKIISIKNIW